MRILLTNSFLASRTGSEMVVRDYALAFARRGHEVAVFTNVLSRAWRRDLAGLGIAAVDRVDSVPWRPAIIHGQHTLAMLAAMARFPQTPVVQWIHDRTDPVDIPLRHPAIAHYVAVDETRAGRVLAAGVGPDRVVVIPNAVDLARFPLRPSVPNGRRVLCIVKRAGLDQTAAIVDHVAPQVGWTADVAGAGVTREIDDMASALQRYDLVIASGRCALEAIATGAAVIVSDDNRLAGLASDDTWPALRRDNLGFDALTAPLSVDRLAALLSAVDLDQAYRFAMRVRPTLSLEAAATRVDVLYDQVVRTHSLDVDPARAAVWREDLDRLVQTLGAGHLAHWRRIADRSDALDQSSPQ